MYLREMKDGMVDSRTVEAPNFTKEFDVIVCGLGTAGSLAALFCAEKGLSVLGIEKLTCVGGTHTAGGVRTHYFGCPGGLYEKLDQEVKNFSLRYAHGTTESRKLLVEEALVEQGVEILYESAVCGVYLEDRTVVGLRVLTGGKIIDCRAGLVMDCTAEAFIASMAGCATQMGRAADGQTQPYSLMSLVIGNEKCKFTNIDIGRVNQYDQWELSDALLFSRGRKTEEAYQGKTFLAQTSLLGIREGKRIIAEEMVQLEDLFADRYTKTPMFYSYADLDKHGRDTAFDGETLGDWAVGANLGAYNVTVPVPYKAILPKDYEGILVPCRALGVDRDISSCVRMIPDMKKLAEVAAHWVALAIQNKCALRAVPYEALREKLLESGCLDERYNRGCRIDGNKSWDGSAVVKRDVRWIDDPQKLEEGLRSITPGEAIWSAKRMGETALPVLRQHLLSDDENLRKHAAFALASLGQTDANELLREMVRQRDSMMLRDCRKNNNIRSIMAVYWLGRLADRDIAEELIQLICNPDEVNKPLYQQLAVNTPHYTIHDFKDNYFQMMSHSVMALIRIGDAHDDLRERIGQAFTAAFSSDDYYHRTTGKPKDSSEGNMVQTIKTVAFLALGRWNEQTA